MLETYDAGPRVLVVAADLLARTGLAALLATEESLDVVGQVAGGENLALDLQIYRPDVAVYDLGYDANGRLDHISTLTESEMALVALLPPADNALAHVLSRLRESNAGYGVLPRDSDSGLVAAAVLAARAGLVVLEPSLAAQALPTGDASLAGDQVEVLTPRESEVLQWLARGLTNKAIGQKLEISANTVKFHVNAILAKLDAQSRTEAVVRATQLGLIVL